MHKATISHEEAQDLMYLLACMQAALLKQAGFKDLEQAAELFNEAMKDELADDVNKAATELITLCKELKEQHPEL